jgi:tetratricopeptide (TPR) repeat protein
MNLKSTIRATFMPAVEMTPAIIERARCCPRPNVWRSEQAQDKTRADYEFWEALAARFLSKSPDNADGWIVLGHSRCHLYKMEGALKAYRVAVRLRDDADTWFSLGCCASGEEQIAAYRTAIKHNQSDGISWYYLANALAYAKRHEEAIQCFATALEHFDNPSAAWVLCDLGLCYLAVHHLLDSLAAFERSVLADGGYAFYEMSTNIADACQNEPPDFARALYLQIELISPGRADFFLKCLDTTAVRMARRRARK